MSFTFLHAADLHLGSPLKGLSMRDETVAARFALAGRAAFSELIDRSLAERVAFAIIAGDIYDGDWKDMAIGHFFNREIARLTRAGIPVYIVKGNHDAESVVTRSLPLPQGVHVFAADAAETVEIAALQVALHGRSFRDRVVSENLALAYPSALPGHFNIGILHTSLSGNPQHETYAPCSLSDLGTRGYDYWALGHIHEFQIVSRQPHVVYPGNLQGRSIRECGAKGAVFVDVDQGQVTQIRRVIVDKARFVDLPVDIGAATDESDVDERVRTSLATLQDLAEGRPLAVRLRLSGLTALHGSLLARQQQKRDDFEALLGQAVEDAWLEKLQLLTRAPEVSPTTAAPTLIDTAGMLAALEHDPDVRDAARQFVDELATRWPGTTDMRVEDLLADLDTLLADARMIVLARAAGPLAPHEREG